MGKKGSEWTEEEIKLLHECYKKKMLMPEMASLFPNRTPKAIQKKANTYGLQSKYPKYPDLDYSQRHKWTKEDEEFLENEYSKYTKIEEIAKMMGLEKSQIEHKAVSMGLPDKYIRKNSNKYTAIYQDYDWCYERYVNRGMTHEEMAKEAGCEVRVMKKWCNDIHGIHSHTFKELKTLNDIQYQIIMFGTLGDGHIDRREDQPMYIESHCEEEKDYLFWKYNLLKDLCNQGPVYYPASYGTFGTDKEYLCQPFYRLNTRIINELKEIREMPRIEKINQLNELGFCLHILDDGNRDNLWHVCLAEWSQVEMDVYQNVCAEKFNIFCKQCKDTRYYSFDAVSSKRIDWLILKNIPNELDIVHKKIIDNDKIKELCNYRFVLTQNEKIGLSSYCRANKLLHKYDEIRDLYDEISTNNQITESELLSYIGVEL